jgi:hypothetical protein
MEFAAIKRQRKKPWKTSGTVDFQFNFRGLTGYSEPELYWRKAGIELYSRYCQYKQIPAVFGSE